MSATRATVASIGQDLVSLRPVIAVLALTLLLTIVIRVARWIWLRWWSRSPRVQITAFSWAAAGEDDHEATWITSLFREQLSNLRLDPLDAVPDRAPGAPLVEIIEGIGQGLAHRFDLGAALGRLYRAAFPDAAYEVWGTLRPLHEGGGRISVQLIDRSRGNQTVVSVVSDKGSWEESASQAAMAVAGGLYPQVGKRHRGPWTRWTHKVPLELVELYHQARQHEADDRIEQALGAYHAALSNDPVNPHLRLKIAMLQEQLGLDLDAWVTYNAIIDGSDRGAWKGPDRKARLLALYRLAILLCNGRIAAQWVDPDFAGEKGSGRPQGSNPRRELRMALKRDPLVTDGKRLKMDYYTQAVRRRGLKSLLVRGAATTLLYDLPDRGHDTDPEEWIDKRFPDPCAWNARNKRKHLRRIKEALEIVGLRRLEDLDSRLRVRPPSRLWRFRTWQIRRTPMGRWFRRREFSRAAVRISKRLTRLRIAASADRRIDADGPKGKRPAAERERLHKKVSQAHRKLTRGWPFPSTRLWTPAIRSIRPRRRWADRRDDSWQLHYNAACAAASTLLDDSLLSLAREPQSPVLPGDTDKRAVIRAAIDELEEYAHRAGSSRVVQQADWIALEDPDLASLFETEEFRLWASHHLPRELPKDRPSRDIDVNLVSLRMLQQSARAFARCWQARAEVKALAPDTVAAWWREERKAWRTSLQICAGPRSWGHRLECLNALQECFVATQAVERIDFSHASRAADVRKSGDIELVLKGAAKLVGEGTPPASGISRWVDRRAEYVRALHENSSRGMWERGLALIEIERAEARRAAHVWDALAKALANELNGDGEASSGFSAVAEMLPAEDRPKPPPPDQIDELPA